MIHIIYISIITLLSYLILKTYSFANRKHKELESYKRISESRKVPYEILSKHEKAYVDFYKWIKNNNVKSDIIEKYNDVFNF